MVTPACLPGSQIYQHPLQLQPKPPGPRLLALRPTSWGPKQKKMILWTLCCDLPFWICFCIFFDSMACFVFGITFCLRSSQELNMGLFEHIVGPKL
mmetsp:Transcript_145343/g.253637  ORF Transcript_145343/g.253637 Transcript_145343/m.253637 type:complete len:96 (+) Transcript_145343:979-1266(+)